LVNIIYKEGTQAGNCESVQLSDWGHCAGPTAARLCKRCPLCALLRSPVSLSLAHALTLFSLSGHGSLVAATTTTASTPTTATTTTGTNNPGSTTVGGAGAGTVGGSGAATAAAAGAPSNSVAAAAAAACNGKLRAVGVCV